jgi:hypothetical protein
MSESIKRYVTVADSCMEPDGDGEWVRFDDPALRALVEAAERAQRAFGEIRLDAGCAMSAEFVQAWLDNIACNAVRTAEALTQALRPFTTPSGNGKESGE